ncbi:hypothetical protein J7413_19660 [Shimia sp. R10_1]|nr:hypothetical protein [Shimia sp. R10_1]
MRGRHKTTYLLSLFDFNTNNVRVIEIDNEPWFVAKDVCDALDIKKARTSVTAVVSDDNKAHLLKSSLTNAHGVGLSYPNRGATCINEAGLYELIFTSCKPEAMAFKDWVTTSALPAIRKDGGYVMGEEKQKTGASKCLSVLRPR